MVDLARELEERFGNRAVDGLWCTVPARIMLQIIDALKKAPLPPSDGDWGKVLSRAIHEHLCRRDIMQYLDNEEDCAGLAKAALTALTPLIAKVREEVLESAAQIISKIEPDEEAAGCPASWGDFVQIAQSEIRSIQSGDHIRGEG